jgi:uncharacterized protein YjiS (DUF1127 family)
MSDFVLTNNKVFSPDSGPVAIMALLRKWRVRARQRAELARLGERDLHDLGWSRAQVEFEINKPFWRA